MRKNEENLN